MKKILLLMCGLAFVGARAQTLTDGLMMQKKDFCTGVIYTYDTWKNYWEGALKRDNQNLGTVTTQTATWMGSYGLTEKINIIAMVPYVWGNASGVTWHPLNGIQDLTLGVKYRFFNHDFTNGSLKAFALASGSIPLSNYDADYLPVSIGLQSKTFTPRLSVSYKMNNGWFSSISGGYTFRSNITLDRTDYLVDNQLFTTSEVAMYNQFSFSSSVGWNKKGLLAELNYMQQNTIGGGDIHKQETPFANNQFNFSKLGVTAMYFLPKPKNLAVRAGASYTLSGRNVGQSTTVMAGLLYTFHFNKQSN